MKRIRTLILSTLMMAGVLMVPLTIVTPDASAACVAGSSPKDCIKSGSNVKTGGGDTPLSDQIKTVVNILLFILGAIAVIMIVVGGIRYTISNGESGAITGAKNTILYAVIGLIVAMLAYSIVNFVVGRF